MWLLFKHSITEAVFVKTTGIWVLTISRSTLQMELKSSLAPGCCGQYIAVMYLGCYIFSWSSKLIALPVGDTDLSFVRTLEDSAVMQSL